MKRRPLPYGPPTYCKACGKPTSGKGYFGAQCQCHVSAGNALKGAPSVGTQR